MKKIVLLLMFWLVMAGSVSAADRQAGQSATLSAKPSVVEQKMNKTDLLALASKRRAILSVLSKYDSPMTGSVDAFLHACVKYNIDCYLLPSIAGLESSFGAQTLPGSHNAFGWGGGYIMFDTWDAGIDAVARGLATDYIGQGRVSVDAIGPKYSESATWAVRVNRFVAQFEATEQSDTLHSAMYSL